MYAALGIATILAAFVGLLVYLYRTNTKLRLDGADSLSKELDDKLKAAEAAFADKQREERHEDETEAATVSDVPGAVDFVRDSFGPRKEP